MKHQMDDAEIVDLERSFSALADEDRHLEAPSHVHRAVMRRWDLSRPLARRRHQLRGRDVRLLAIGTLAAAASVAVAVMDRAPSARLAREPSVAREVEKAPVVSPLSTADRDARNTRRPRRRRGGTLTSVSPDEPVMVLVMDPTLDRSAATIVRVRVPRATLLTLGIPLAEPERSGLVGLEMLVGEDGIARTIRRAVPVASDRE